MGESGQAGGNILSIDDDANDAFLLRAAVRKCGFSGVIRFAMDGHEAVEVLHSSVEPRPDLILLDLKMPQMSGFEVLQWLANQERLADTCVSVFTSSSDPGDILRAYALGADLYLVKPMGFQELLALTGSFDRVLANGQVDLKLLRTLAGFRSRP